jgi:hypothetical protein
MVIYQDVDAIGKQVRLVMVQWNENQQIVEQFLGNATRAADLRNKDRQLGDAPVSRLESTDQRYMQAARNAPAKTVAAPGWMHPMQLCHYRRRLWLDTPRNLRQEFPWSSRDTMLNGMLESSPLDAQIRAEDPILMCHLLYT